jgi:LysM repeat protein
LRSPLARYGAPAVFLAAATAAILLVHAGLTKHPRIPPAASAGAPAAVVVRAARPAASRPARHLYAIRAGDTLEAVASRFGTTVDRLLAMNPGVQPTSLRIGQRIRTR